MVVNGRPSSWRERDLVGLRYTGSEEWELFDSLRLKYENVSLIEINF